MSVSRFSLWFSIVLLSTISFFYYPKWNKEQSEATISWDVSGYYWYLPAIFIYHDLKHLSFSDQILSTYKPTPYPQQSFNHRSNQQVLKYSSGQAILMLPGFILGHISSKILLYPSDGFSKPYQFGIFIWSLIVTLIGLIMLRKILVTYFDETSSGLTILTICFGTNFLEYGAITNAMTHNYLFTLYTILIWATIQFYNTKKVKFVLAIGLCLGLMALTRPSEIIAIIIPLFYGVSFNMKAYVERIKLWFLEYKKLLIAATITSGIGFIQLLYWKYVTDEWLVYSYEDQGFSWLKPHILDCLFSGRAGWLIYTPIMVLSLYGFVPLFKNFKSLAPTLFLFSLLFFYITFAWDIWWYGGSVSQRALVQLYAVLAFPLTAFFQSIFMSMWKIIATSIFALFCIFYNFWMTHQCHYGGMFVAGDMTSGYLKEIFLKNELPPHALKLLDTKNIYKHEIKNPTTLMSAADTSNFIRNMCLGDSIKFSPAKKFKLPANSGWLRASAEFKTDDKEWNVWKMTQFIIKYYKNGHDLRIDVLRVQRHLNQGENTKLWLDSKIRNKADEVEVYIWNADTNKGICFENVQLIYHKGL